MRSQATSRWVSFRRPDPRVRLRLFCFPFAGGGASIYSGWPRHFPPEIEICAVQPPGRENRLGESPYKRMEPLADALSSALRPYLDIPFAMFGHSLGAAVGYEAARRLDAWWGKRPLHLIVSARPAPQIPRRDEPSHLLSDKEFVEKLGELKGTPEDVLANPELLDLLMPVLRADFELNDAYFVPSPESLVCPVTAFGGVEDDEVTKDDLSAWRVTTQETFRMRMFPGDHFFILRRPESVCAAVYDVLRAYL